MNFFIFLLTLVLGISVNKCFSKDVNYLFYTFNNGSKIVVNGSNSALNPVDVPHWTAQAFYNASLNLTGWDILEVWSNPDFPDEDQAYHAGYIEGYVSRDEIWNYYYNNVEMIAKSNKSGSIYEYFNINNKYIHEMTKNNDNHPYWYQVKLIYIQIQGILDGYNNATQSIKATSQKLQYNDILFQNFYEDMIDIFTSYRVKQNRTHDNSTKSNETDLHHHGGRYHAGAHCSALIKLLPGNSDVLIGHDTWSGYQMMNRVLKRYKLPFKVSKNSTQLIPGMNTAFSSYPGCIASIDDFYVMGSGIVALETTNEIYNNSMYSDVHPEKEVVEEIRNVVANRLATNGQIWMDLFRVNNSGTYNNQWMIVNMNKFKPGFDPEDGFLTVIEQAPGIVIGEDQTTHLREYEYWASYNIPFYPIMYKITGNEAIAKNDSWFSYNECPRAKIFKKEQSKVTDMTSMQWLMRYNNFMKDPYSACEKCSPKMNACNAIAARCDLNSNLGNYTEYERPSLFGAIDTKIIGYSLFSKGKLWAMGGPTSEGVHPFIWSQTAMNKTGIRHQGQPDKWDFDPIITSWVIPHIFDKSNDDEPPVSPTEHSKKGGVSATEPTSVLIYLLPITLFFLKSHS